MKKQNLKIYFGFTILTLISSIFLLSCVGCGSTKYNVASKKEREIQITTAKNNVAQEDTNLETTIVGKDFDSENKILPSSNKSQSLKILVENDELFLKDIDSKIIFRDDLANINPFLISLGLNKKDYREEDGLYFLGENFTKKDSRIIFSDEKAKLIPNDYYCNFANIGPPITTTNKTEMFAASFIFEWGNSLFDEVSIGEYQCSKIYVWNVKGELIKRISHDFGVTPYFTKSGKYLWLEYAEFTKNQKSQKPEIIPCISLMDIENEVIVFEKKFPGQDINVGGYNNSTDFFGFTISKSNNDYQLYYFDDVNETLYYRHFKNQNTIENLTIEKDFIRKKIN